jgi:hypothetical protein
MKKNISEGNVNLLGKYKGDLINGPKNHGSRAFGNWQSDNAWDLFAPANTKWFSLTNGKVIKVYNTGKTTGKVYGTQVTVSGKDGYPTIFYTHLKDVAVKMGQEIKVGDYIGLVSEWGKSKSTHVHVGLPYGLKIQSLLSSDYSKPTKGDFNYDKSPIQKVDGEIKYNSDNSGMELNKDEKFSDKYTEKANSLIKRIFGIKEEFSNFKNILFEQSSTSQTQTVISSGKSPIKLGDGSYEYQGGTPGEIFSLNSGRVYDNSSEKGSYGNSFKIGTTSAGYVYWWNGDSNIQVNGTARQGQRIGKSTDSTPKVIVKSYSQTNKTTDKNANSNNSGGNTSQNNQSKYAQGADSIASNLISKTLGINDSVNENIKNIKKLMN